MPKPPAKHGTESGYQSHRKTWHTPACEDCKRGHREYKQALEGRKAALEASDRRLMVVPPRLEADPEPADPSALDPEREKGPIEVALVEELDELVGTARWKPTIAEVAVRMARHLDAGRPDIASAATGRLLELMDRLSPPAKEAADGGLKLAALGTPD